MKIGGKQVNNPGYLTRLIDDRIENYLNFSCGVMMIMSEDTPEQKRTRIKDLGL